MTPIKLSAFAGIFALTLSACAGVQNQGSGGTIVAPAPAPAPAPTPAPVFAQDSFPEVGEVVTVNIGDPILLAGRYTMSDGSTAYGQALYYGGRDDDNARLSYRQTAAPSGVSTVATEVDYDLHRSELIEYRGALLEVLDFDADTITYRVSRAFMVPS